ncbi:MAG: hypothetical protein LBI56_03630 [Puniceicoccales bacterium]|nr:hypothetical protein [Puniceicoccales bacterium]
MRRMKSAIRAFLLSGILFFISGCETQPHNYTYAAPPDQITIGTVQRFIRNGMYSYEVIDVLGAPNMVTKNAEGCETWVYDKIHSEYETRSSSSGLDLILFETGSARRTGSSGERTLTIIIHFDSEAKVSDFSYRTTSF